jgi:pyruvyltransferase
MQSLAMRFLNKAAAQRLRSVALEYGRLAVHPHHVCGYWWRGDPNFGDALSPLVLNWISGYKVLNIENLPWYRGPVYLTVGSILDSVNVDNVVVWGSGFISSQGRMAMEPKQILAVRGPLTRQKLLDQGVKCPEVYGDPGLLVRRMFDSALTKEFEYGIVPHIDDKGLIPPLLAHNDGVNIIDVQSNPMEFVRELCRCKRILSSSLHGLITADAFGIPSAQFCLSDQISGGGIFKFMDYYKSVGREPVAPFDLTKLKEIEEAEEYLVLTDVEPTIRALLDASPFPLQDRPDNKRPANSKGSA